MKPLVKRSGDNTTFVNPYFDIAMAVTEAGSVLSVLEKSVCIVSL